MISPAAGGLLPAGTASTAMGVIFPPSRRKVLETLNQGKRLYLILVFVQAVYAHARFWEGGARCFVEGFRLDHGWYLRLEHFDCQKDPLFPARQISSRRQVSSRSQYSPSKIEKCGIMLALKGVVFLYDLIWCLNRLGFTTVTTT